MKTTVVKLSLILISHICLTIVSGQSGEVILNDMFEASKNANQYEYEVFGYERLKDEPIVQDAKSISYGRVKVQDNPQKLYLKDTNSGIEVLWVKGINNNKALVNPNGFPYFNLKLNPEGTLMRKGKHHSVLRVGFKYFYEVLEYYVAERRVDVTFIEHNYFEGAPVEVIRIDINKFEFKSYTGKKGETLKGYCDKMFINDYMVYSRNSNLSSLHSSISEKTIIVPSAYAKYMILYVDSMTKLPRYISVYDDLGLYQLYELRNLKTNVLFSENEFKPDYEKYNF